MVDIIKYRNRTLKSLCISKSYSLLTFQDKSKDSKANPLSVKNIGGVFVVLLCGLLASIIVAVLEFCWNSRKVLQYALEPHSSCRYINRV